MSRIGKNPVTVPAGVEVSLDKGVITAKGKNGSLSMPVSALVEVKVGEKEVTVSPRAKAKRNRMMWGTTRNLISNLVVGVSEGFTRRLEINGVGYRAQVKGNSVQLALGYSHDINFALPEGLKAGIEGERNNVLAISGIDRAKVGQVASEIRKLRPPEPYKGKGVKYLEERIVRKEGKKK